MRRTAQTDLPPSIGEARLLVCSLLHRARGNPAQAARLARVHAAAERLTGDALPDDAPAEDRTALGAQRAALRNGCRTVGAAGLPAVAPRAGVGGGGYYSPAYRCFSVGCPASG